jgi:ribonuclease R
LADAAHFAAPGDALFDEALARGTSFYLPGLMIPMLPSNLSEGVVSLNAEVPRRAFTFLIELNEVGEVIRSEFFLAHIRSQAKLTYDGVQAFLDGDPELAEKPFAQSLHLLKEVGTRRRRVFEHRDVVRFDRVATRMSISDDERLEIAGAPRNGVQLYNEQISLLCNIEGAKLLMADGSGRGIFRLHDAPTKDKVDKFVVMLDALASSRNLPDEWRWDRQQESLADYVERLPDSGEEGHRLACAIQRQAMVMAMPSYF